MERWQRWMRGRIVVLVGAVLLVVGGWWGLVRNGGDAEGSDAAGASPEPLDVSEALDLVPGCRQDLCRVVARRGGFRDRGQRAALVVVADGGDRCRELSSVRVHLVDPEGVVWSGPSSAVCGDPVGGIESDRAGNAFLRFPAGTGPDHDDRLVVLRVGSAGVDDFGSFGGRFDGAGVAPVDVDDDGVREIVVPGEGEPVVHRWTGSGWRGPG